MIRLSPGVIPDVIALLQYVLRFKVDHVQQLAAGGFAHSVKTETAVEFAQACGLLDAGGGAPHVTECGLRVIGRCACGDVPETAQRMILRSYVLFTKPLWAYKTPSGRRVADAYMSEDERACFRYAGLLSELPSDDVVAWWDEVSSAFRGAHDRQLLEVGRCGERLSLAYEQARTGVPPKWESAESNLSGFDIVSRVSREDHRPLYIEVKASEQTYDAARASISTHEWRVALAHGAAGIFHLWLLSNAPLVAPVTTEALAPHIPNNCGAGEWETASIPFSACAGKSEFVPFYAGPPSHEST